jgi:hypothetical protein
MLQGSRCNLNFVAEIILGAWDMLLKAIHRKCKLQLGNVQKWLRAIYSQLVLKRFLVASVTEGS